MKKILQKTIILLCFIPVAFVSAKSKNPNPDKWHDLSTGRYYSTRYSSFYKGLNKLNSKNYENSAKQCIKSLSGTWKYNFGAYNNYGVASGMLANYDQAIGLFKKSILAGGNEEIAKFNIFTTYMNRKKYSEAYKMIQQIPAYLQNNYPEEIGTCYILNNHYADAYNFLKLYIQKDSTIVSDFTYYNASLASWIVMDNISAIKYIKKSIEKNSENLSSQILMGKIFLNIDPEVSITAFLKATSLAPENIECQMGLGYSYISAGEGKKAKRIFENIIKKGNSKDPDVFQGLAIAFGQCNEEDNAFVAMEEVAKRRSLSSFDNRILGDLWLNKDSLANAFKFYTIALKDGFNPDAALGLAIYYFLKDEMNNAYNMIVAIESSSPNYKLSDYGVFLKAMIYYSKGLFDKFSEAMDNSSFGRSKESSKLMILAMKSISQFQLEEGKNYLNKAIKMEPNNLNLQLILGTVNFQLGNYIVASEIFNRAHLLDTNNLEIRNGLALALSEIGQRSSAIEIMKSVIKKDPKERYYNNMALVLTNEARKNKDTYDNVCNYYETAILYVDSALAAGASPEFAINKGNFYYELKDTVNAKKYFDSNTPFALNNFSVMCFLDNRLTEAANFIDKAIALSKEHICPAILNNQEVIKNGYFNSGKNMTSEPQLIYLYQVMPAILPSHHLLSYSFKMKDNTPLHVDGSYILYNSLEGETNISKNTRGLNISMTVGQ